MKTIIPDSVGQFWIRIVVEGQRTKELGPFNSFAEADTASRWHTKRHHGKKQSGEKQSETPNKNGHTGRDVLGDYTFTLSNRAIYKDGKKLPNSDIIRIDSLVIRRTTLLKYIASLVS